MTLGAGWRRGRDLDSFVERGTVKAWCSVVYVPHHQHLQHVDAVARVVPIPPPHAVRDVELRGQARVLREARERAVAPGVEAAVDAAEGQENAAVPPRQRDVEAMPVVTRGVGLRAYIKWGR